MSSDRIKATYTNGAFVPHTPFDLPDDTKVELTINRVDNPYIQPARITDPVERARVLKEMVERMKANPIPADAPRFTRDELHERR